MILKTKSKLIKSIFILLLFSTICILLPLSVSAATRKYVENSTTYVFVSTSGEVCSSTVSVTLIEEFSVFPYNNFILANYPLRTVMVTHSYIATWTKPEVTIPIIPRHIDLDGSTLSTFSWTNIAIIVEPGTYNVYSVRNNTSKTYLANNDVRLSTTYMVGNSSYMITPYRTKMVSLDLRP